jgi:hypothetical protein
MSTQWITKGDMDTVSLTLTSRLTPDGAAQSISEPTALAAELYSGDTLVASISVTPGDATGWATSAPVVPVAFTAANTPAPGVYVMRCKATYVAGVKSYPSNDDAIRLEIRSPGALR